MRFHHVGLVATVMFAYSNAALGVTVPKLIASDFLARSLNEEHNSPRYLRMDSAVIEGGEERGISFNSIPGIEKLSKFVDKLKLARWMKKGKTADDVFAKMKLAKAGDKLFDDPKFLAWVKYVDNYNNKNPGKETSLIPTLQKVYGDDVLARMLEAATKVGSTRVMAMKLQNQQMKSWNDLGLSTDDVFRVLNLDKRLDNLLTNPNFLTYNKYLVDFNVWNPGKSTTMIETLTRSYGDVAVMKMLEAAKKVESSKTIATNLQTQQLEVWKSMGYNSDDVFRLLNLDDGVDSILANPMFSMWVKYLDDFNANNPAKKTTVFDTLRSHFSDSVLSQLLIAAQKNPSTKKMATQLQGQQIQKWLDNKEFPNTVFKYLTLDKGVDNLLANPQLNTWIKYADDYKVENPFTTKATMIDTFMFHYTEASLIRMLAAAKKVASTKKMATNLEVALLSRFLTAKKDPLYVAKVLKVSEKTDTNWKLLETYTNDFNRKYLRGTS